MNNFNNSHAKIQWHLSKYPNNQEIRGSVSISGLLGYNLLTNLLTRKRNITLKKKLIVLATIVSSLNLLSPLLANAIELNTVQQRSGYSVGMGYAESLRQQGIDISAESFIQGFKDSYSGAKPALSEAQMQKAIEELQTLTLAKKAETERLQSEKNQTEGKAFLAANKSKADVVTLPSGLQYKVVKTGTGSSPKLTDVVTTHYRGTLLNGEEFDSSYKRNQPASFPVNGVIPGWTEALQLMKVGDKWQLFLPAELAYGSQAPRGSVITPNSTLLFDIELLEIKK